MPKILVVTYDFPPYVGGGNVMRTVKLCKYLHYFNWECHVLARKNNIKSFVADYSLNDDIKNAKIYYVSDIIGDVRNFFGNKIFNSESKNKSFLRKGETLTKKISNILFEIDRIFFWDPAVGYILPAIIKGISIFKKHSFDYIYSTSPPNSTHVVAYYLSYITGCSLIMDYRDDWVGNPLYLSYNKINNFLNKYFEYKAVKQARLVISTTPAISKKIENRYNRKVFTIWNGYDESDFAGLELINNQNSKIKLSYVGSVGKHKTLLPIIKAIESSELKDILIFEIIGHVYNEYNYIKNSPVVCRITGMLPHKDALKNMMSADALVLVLSKSEDGMSAIPGKVFEYIRCQKPIFAICPFGGQLWKFISDNNLGICIDNSSTIEEIKKGLTYLIDLIKSGTVSSSFNYSFFSRKTQTKRLLELLEGNNEGFN